MSEEKSEVALESVQWLIGTFAEAIADVVEFTTGERPQVAADTAPSNVETPESDQSVSWWEQKLDISEDAAIWVGSVPDTWRQLGDRGLKAAGVEDGTDSDIRSTYDELLQQSLSSVAQKIGGRTGSEVTCLGATADATKPEVPLFALEIQCGDGAKFPLQVAFSTSVIAALSQAQDSDGSEAPEAPSSSNSANEEAELQPAGGAELPKAIELLLDVELPVSVSFGRAHLALKDVIKLTSGSIVELNRSVSEPVEVIVNNCVIARGEVVVVDGNYGVRIFQIISRRERLRTLN